MEDGKGPREKESAQCRKGKATWHDGESEDTVCRAQKGYSLGLREWAGEKRKFLWEFLEGAIQLEAKGAEKGAGDKKKVWLGEGVTTPPTPPEGHSSSLLTLLSQQVLI